MNFILRLKHWQVFLILLISAIASNFTWTNHEAFTLGANLFGLLVYFFWLLAVGLELTEYLPSKVELPRTFFVINGVILLISMVIVMTVFDGQYSDNSLVGFLWIIYLMFAMFQFLFYPAKALKSVEQENEATFAQYFGYFLLMIFWPVGIWSIQPKLNKINSRYEIHPKH